MYSEFMEVSAHILYLFVLDEYFFNIRRSYFSSLFQNCTVPWPTQLILLQVQLGTGAKAVCCVLKAAASQLKAKSQPQDHAAEVCSQCALSVVPGTSPIWAPELTQATSTPTAQTLPGHIAFLRGPSEFPGWEQPSLTNQLSPQVAG